MRCSGKKRKVSVLSFGLSFGGIQEFYLLRLESICALMVRVDFLVVYGLLVIVSPCTFSLMIVLVKVEILVLVLYLLLWTSCLQIVISISLIKFGIFEKKKAVSMDLGICGN